MNDLALPALVVCPVVATLIGLAHIRNPKFHERGLFVIALLPWVLVLVTYVIAFYLRLTLDRSWPHGWDNIHPYFAEQLIRYLFFSTVIFYGWVVPIWFGWLLLGFMHLSRKLTFFVVAIFLLGTTISALLHWYDPGGFFHWAMIAE